MQLVKTEGEVDVINDRGRSMDIFEEMGLYSGYHVDTRAKSQAWINLDSTKLTKMDEESQVEVKGDKGKLEMIVHSGRVFFHVLGRGAGRKPYESVSDRGNGGMQH